MQLAKIYSMARQTAGIEVKFIGTDDPYLILDPVDGRNTNRDLFDYLVHLDGRFLWFSGLDGKIFYDYQAVHDLVSSFLCAINTKAKVGFVLSPQAAGNGELLEIAKRLRSDGYNIVLGDGDPTKLDAKCVAGDGRYFDVLRVSAKKLPPVGTELATACRHVLRAYAAIGLDISADLVDTSAEFAQVRAFGFTLFQGHIAPNSVPQATTISPTSRPNLFAGIERSAAQAAARGAKTSQRLAHLCEPATAFHRWAQTKEVLRHLVSSPYRCVPIVEGTAPAGILRASTVFENLAECYRMQESCDREVSWLVEHDVPVLDAATEVAALGDFLENHRPDKDFGVIVASNGMYDGWVPIEKLISARHNEEVSAARESNPLTGLPGNAAVYGAWERFDTIPANAGGQAAIVVVDINFFKQFNDVFSVHRADMVIKGLASVLTETATQYEERGSHVTHVGGDDFLVLLPLSVVDEWASKVIARWRQIKTQYFRPEDLEVGYFVSRSREGVLSKVPLAEITVASATGSACEEAIDRACKLKLEMRQDSGVHFSGGYRHAGSFAKAGLQAA